MSDKETRCKTCQRLEELPTSDPKDFLRALDFVLAPVQEQLAAIAELTMFSEDASLSHDAVHGISDIVWEQYKTVKLVRKKVEEAGDQCLSQKKSDEKLLEALKVILKSKPDTDPKVLEVLELLKS